METSGDSMTTPWSRYAWSMLDRVLAELVSLNPACAVLFRSVGTEEVAEGAAEDVASAPRAA